MLRRGSRSCLGSGIAELAAGLGAAADRTRAVEHLQGCSDCRTRWDLELLLLRQLRHTPLLSAQLQANLMRLAVASPDPWSAQLEPGQQHGSHYPLPELPLGAGWPVLPRQRRHRRVLAASAVTVGAGALAAGVLLWLGPGQLDRPTQVPLSQFGSPERPTQSPSR